MNDDRLTAYDFVRFAPIGRVSREARLFHWYIAIFSDEMNRVSGDRTYLARQFYPYDDSVGPEVIESWIQELEAQALVRRTTLRSGPHIVLLPIERDQRFQALDRLADLGQEFDAAPPQSTNPPISVDLDEKSQRDQ